VRLEEVTEKYAAIDTTTTAVAIPLIAIEAPIWAIVLAGYQLGYSCFLCNFLEQKIQPIVA